MQKQKQNTARETAIEDAMALIATLEMPYLVTLSVRLDEHIEQRRRDALTDARRQIEQIAASVGIPLETLISMPASGTKGKYPPRYRHPNWPNSTWSGMGRKPVWVTDLENGGYTLEQLRITDEEK